MKEIKGYIEKDIKWRELQEQRRKEQEEQERVSNLVIHSYIIGSSRKRKG